MVAKTGISNKIESTMLYTLDLYGRTKATDMANKMNSVWTRIRYTAESVRTRRTNVAIHTMRYAAAKFQQSRVPLVPSL